MKAVVGATFYILPIVVAVVKEVADVAEIEFLVLGINDEFGKLVDE